MSTVEFSAVPPPPPSSFKDAAASSRAARSKEDGSTYRRARRGMSQGVPPGTTSLDRLLGYRVEPGEAQVVRSVLETSGLEPSGDRNFSVRWSGHGLRDSSFK